MIDRFHDAVDAVLKHEGALSLEDILNLRLQERSRVFYKPYKPENNRGFQCKIDNCINVAYAARLCNAHYIRKKLGKPMGRPLRCHSSNGKCSVCEKKTNSKGGWSLCAKHYTAERRKTIRRACISYLGDKCQSCKNTYPDYVYDFHHIDPSKKETSISSSLESYSVKMIAEEVEKCVLLCANCHRIEHHGN